MPVVLRVGGFAFGFFANEHEPAHVHVRYGGTLAVIEIESGRVRQVEHMRDPDLARARALVAEHRQTLTAAWLAWVEKRKGSNGVAGTH